LTKRHPIAKLRLVIHFISIFTFLSGIFIFASSAGAQINAQSTTPGASITASVTSATLVSSDQLRRMEQLTTAFENSTTVFQYDYIEDIHDGRGFTAGRVGFCTGTGDLIEVVKDYTQKKPNNELAVYLPELERLTTLMYKPEAGVTSGLPGFEKAWVDSAKDQLFRDAQDDIVTSMYLNPALDHAKTLGIKSAIGIGFMYDTIIQHGDGWDPDALPAILARTTAIMHGTPATGISELAWVKAFMSMRREDLMHSFGVDSREVWAESVDRVTVYQKLFADKNFNLDGPISFEVYGGKFEIQ
jgi:chitosanase